MQKTNKPGIHSTHVTVANKYCCLLILSFSATPCLSRIACHVAIRRPNNDLLVNRLQEKMGRENEGQRIVYLSRDFRTDTSILRSIPSSTVPKFPKWLQMSRSQDTCSSWQGCTFTLPRASRSSYGMHKTRTETSDVNSRWIRCNGKLLQSESKHVWQRDRDRKKRKREDEWADGEAEKH